MQVSCALALPRGPPPKTADSSLRSGSGVRLLTNAIRVPSGDQAGASSEKRPEVSDSTFSVSTSRLEMAPARVR